MNGQELNETEEDSIVVRCRCGNLIFAAVNKPNVLDGEMFKEVGQMVREGGKVEHMSVEDVRKSKFGCKCD